MLCTVLRSMFGLALVVVLGCGGEPEAPPGWLSDDECAAPLFPGGERDGGILVEDRLWCADCPFVSQRKVAVNGPFSVDVQVSSSGRAGLVMSPRANDTHPTYVDLDTLETVGLDLVGKEHRFVLGDDGEPVVLFTTESPNAQLVLLQHDLVEIVACSASEAALRPLALTVGQDGVSALGLRQKRSVSTKSWVFDRAGIGDWAPPRVLGSQGGNWPVAAQAESGAWLLAGFRGDGGVGASVVVRREDGPGRELIALQSSRPAEHSTMGVHRSPIQIVPGEDDFAAVLLADSAFGDAPFSIELANGLLIRPGTPSSETCDNASECAGRCIERDRRVGGRPHAFTRDGDLIVVFFEEGTDSSWSKVPCGVSGGEVCCQQEFDAATIGEIVVARIERTSGAASTVARIPIPHDGSGWDFEAASGGGRVAFAVFDPDYDRVTRVGVLDLEQLLEGAD